MMHWSCASRGLRTLCTDPPVPTWENMLLPGLCRSAHACCFWIQLRSTGTELLDTMKTFGMTHTHVLRMLSKFHLNSGSCSPAGDPTGCRLTSPRVLTIAMTFGWTIAILVYSCATFSVMRQILDGFEQGTPLAISTHLLLADPSKPSWRRAAAASVRLKF